MEYIEEYANFIETLSEDSFNRLVVEFEKEYWETNDVSLINGPYDGGNDVRVVIDKQDLKNTIQITVQKNYEKKMNDDLDKALTNHINYGYNAVLDFFVSKKISHSKKNNLKKQSLREKGITLNIYDANFFATEANNYSSIKSTLSSLHKQIYPPINDSLDSNTKILYDTLSLSKKVTSLKTNFVQSIVLSFLYQNPSSTVKQIYSTIKETLYKGLSQDWLGNVVGKLKQQGMLIDVGDFFPKQYQLTMDCQEEVQKISSMSNMAEQQLLNDVENILSTYGINGYKDKIADKLYDLYDENYKIDETEFLRNERNRSLNNVFQSLIKYLVQIGIDQEQSHKVANELLDICSNNNFIKKVSVSKMFLTLFKSQKLEAYLSKSPRDIYFDTQVLLRIICSQSEIEKFEDESYNDINSLFRSIEQSSVPINMFTTFDYVNETAGHIVEAIRLERFLDMPYIKSMGRSKNVIFNLFLEFRKKDSTLTFSHFINGWFDVDITQMSYNDTRSMMGRLCRTLKSRFEMLHINVVSIPKFENYEKYKKEYETIYSYLEREFKIYKTSTALHNDLNTILLLSKDYECDVEDFKEPFLITWDRSFFEIRKRMNDRFHELGQWYIYSPSKFANTLSVLNFKIDAKAINYNIVALAENRFNYSNDSVSFMDLLNSFYPNKDLNNWTLAGRLAEMRQNLIDEQSDDNIGESTLPIDEFLMNVYQYYNNPKNGRTYKDLVSLFINNEFVDDIVTIITEYMDVKFDQSVIMKFDLLINKNASEIKKEEHS